MSYPFLVEGVEELTVRRLPLNDPAWNQTAYDLAREMLSVDRPTETSIHLTKTVSHSCIFISFIF